MEIRMVTPTALKPSAPKLTVRPRLPDAQVDLIAGAGHFCWEEKPAEYAALLTSWWVRASGVEKLNQPTTEQGA